MKRSVSIVIPNYNGRHLLEAYMPFTLQVIADAGVPYEVIVVDDCSKDDSVAFMQANHPQVNLIVSPQNNGFSHACNIGIAAAQYELILLLNSDVKLLPGYFNAQWKYFDNDDTFGTMGRIIDMEGDGIQDAARMPRFNGLKLKSSFYYSDDPDADLYTLYLSGANALVDAKKLKAIGGFNELFSPFYCEDLELSIRAWRLNWKCYYEHKSVCRHMGQATTKNYKTASWVKTVYFRNRFFVHAIHMDGLPKLLWFLQITLIDMLPKLLTGKLWLWKSYVAYLKGGDKVTAAKQQMRALMQQYQSNTSLFNVTDGIKKSAQHKNTHRFKA
jgi:GT2 family glycosyltransferase